MSLFNKRRLPIDTFKMTEEIKENLRKGWYSDEYFNNNIKILNQLAAEGYEFGKDENDLDGIVYVSKVKIGELEVEMQIFTRRKPFSVVVGVDEALAILKECTGYYDEEGNFINTYDQLEVEAVYDGEIISYNGNPLSVQPVIKIRGRYRDFGHLETPILGVLGEPTRIATNVYNTLVVAGEKPVLFFPARFAHYKLQGIHGYAYWIATQRYTLNYGKESKAFISTMEQGDWWGGKASGTVAHINIQTFLGNTAKLMMEFARTMPADTPRIALVDFHNDCVGESIKVIDRMWEKYWQLYEEGKLEEAKKYKLYGVRPDTSGNMRDKSVEPLYDRKMDCGVTPRLVHNIRRAIDERWHEWTKNINYTDMSKGIKEIAKQYCHDIKIVVTGGFNVEKISRFEEVNAPVDIYGVGSSLLENCKGSNNDYTADGVRVKINEKWYDLHKDGRRPCYNAKLEKVDLSELT